MNRIWKRVCQMLVAAVILFGCQTMAWALESGAERITEPIDLSQVSSDLSGNGWQWQNDSKTLVFDGVNMKMNYYPGIFTKNEEEAKMAAADRSLDECNLFTVPAGTTLILKDGSINTLNVGVKSAIEALGDLTITGNGEL